MHAYLRMFAYRCRRALLDSLLRTDHVEHSRGCSRKSKEAPIRICFCQHTGVVWSARSQLRRPVLLQEGLQHSPLSRAFSSRSSVPNQGSSQFWSSFWVVFHPWRREFCTLWIQYVALKCIPTSGVHLVDT